MSISPLRPGGEMAYVIVTYDIKEERVNKYYLNHVGYKEFYKFVCYIFGKV